MALDEPNDKDQQFEIDGFKYIVEKDFLERAQPIKVDFHMYGFKLESGMDSSAGCSGCGTGSTSCGC